MSYSAGNGAMKRQKELGNDFGFGKKY